MASVESSGMSIAEELILMLLKDDTGYIAPVSEWRMSCALIGAVLLDLSFQNRLDADVEAMRILDATPLRDDLLDPSLALIASHGQAQTPRYWVERLAADTQEIRDKTFDRLVAKGLLEHDSAGFWFRAGRGRGGGRGDRTASEAQSLEVRSRVMRAIFEDEIPSPRDITVIGLVRACGGFKALLTPEEYEDAEERIDLLAGLDLFGRAVLDAVGSSYRPPLRRAAAPRPMPSVGLWDCLKSSALRSGNLPLFFAEQGERLGPVYALKVGGFDAFVIVGAEMNQWMGRKGRLHLRSRDYIEDFQQAWGTARSIASMDGAEHFRMRKAARAGNARTVVEDRLDEVYELGRASFGQWGVGRRLTGEQTCQRLIGQQIARLSTSIDPPVEVLDGLLEFENRSLNVHVIGVLPKISLKTPKMRVAHAAVLDLYDRIHRSHTPAQRENKRRDLVDDLMELHQSDPQFLPDTDLEFAFIAPLIAGHYVGAAISFAIYELLVNPDVLARVTAEADALFENGDPTAADFDMAAIDVTHRVIMETLRLHPVIPVHNRTAMNAFDVDGKLVPARSKVLVSFPAAHFMAENFADPLKFDIDRYIAPRNEHRKRGAYQPFGVGTHTCLGSRFTELQMVANLLLIARHLNLEMVPRNYRLKVNPLPKLKPRKRFGFRVKSIRHPFAGADSG